MKNAKAHDPGAHVIEKGREIVRARLQQNEFLAAIPCRNLAGSPGHLREDTGHGLQGAITRRMAVAVIELLEMIDIEQGNANRLAVLRRFAGGVNEGFLEGATVRQSRQPILTRQSFEFAALGGQLQMNVDARAQWSGGPVW